MSGRSCSLARRVFFYMSDSYPPKHSGPLAGYKPIPTPIATPTESYPAASLTTASSGCDAHSKSPAFARKIGVAALYPRYDAAVATTSLPCREILGIWRPYPGVFLLKNHMMPGSFHVNLWIVFSCPNTITFPILWLQFYLKCSSLITPTPGQMGWFG